MPAATLSQPKPKPKTKPKAAPLPRLPAKIRHAADLLKQVSDPTRLQVLISLSKKERHVTELCAEIGAPSQPAVSHHLALLRHGRLIESRRDGKHNYYGLTDTGRKLVALAGTLSPVRRQLPA